MKKLNKSKITKNMICSVSLVVALLITGIFAFMATTDKKSNVVTLGDISLELIENGWEKVTDTNSENYGCYVSTNGSSVNTIPGTAISKAPYITNTGDNSIWTYIIVKVPTLTDEEFANSRVYREHYGAKYNIENTAIGIQDGLIKDKDNSISDTKQLWVSCYGNKNSFFDEEPAKTERKEAIVLNGLNTTDWEQITVYKGTNHNYYVYGYKTLLNKNASTPSLYTSFTLNTLFGTGYNATTIQTLGGCLYYIDTDASAGCDEYGHPYRYTFYDEDGNKLKENEIYASNHKISKYKVDIPEFYENEYKAGRITLAEYNAIPTSPVKDKYYVMAATKTPSKWELININPNPSTELVWSTENSAGSPLTYPLDIYLKSYLNTNNLASQYYDIDGDTWTLKNFEYNTPNDEIGAGKHNTAFIREFCASDPIFYANNTIWKVLDSFNANNDINQGHNDWYIPSREELFQAKFIPASALSSETDISNAMSSSERNADRCYRMNADGIRSATLTKWTGEVNLYVTRSF